MRIDAILWTSVLTTAATASPFKGWGRPWRHPGWHGPGVYTSAEPEQTTIPAWGGYHTTSAVASSTVSSGEKSSTFAAYTSHRSTSAASLATSNPNSSASGQPSSTSGAFSTSLPSLTVSYNQTRSALLPSGTGASSSISACHSLRPRRSSSADGATQASSSPASSGATASSRQLSMTRSILTGTASGTATSGTLSLPPCASVSKLVASVSRTTTAGGAVVYPTVPAQLAYQCLNSIPFNASAATSWLDSLRPYIQWQTTIEYLKDPPAEYAAKVQAPYDFYANFDRIYSQTQAGDYASEYAFGFDIYTAFQKAHDGHFVIYPDSVTTIFTFGRQTPLVSVSLDGTSLPQIYAYQDVLTASFGNASFEPSPITKIDGQDSTDFLLTFAENTGSLQDPDALWNNVFYSLAQVALGTQGTGTGAFSGGGRGRLQYPGPTTSFTFANGTESTTENFARVLVPFTNITDGASIYRKFFTIPAGEPQTAEEIVRSLSSQSTSVASRTASRSAVSSIRASASLTAMTSSPPSGTTVLRSTATVPNPGYPTNPIAREAINLNSGYFLDGADYEDVAVLAVNSFVGTDADELPFQAVNTYLINQAVANNKTKLIIDVSANGGGTILQGYDLFKQLFPSINPYGAQRFRAHEAIDLVGQEYSAYSALVQRSLSLNDTAANTVASPFNYRSDLDINGEPFDSWPEKYGPHAYGPQPDNFTSLFRWNFSDVLTPINSGGIYVSGYLNRSNITTQPFAAENIVVVTDGYCASTCTIFSELMRQQGGVKYVSLGGRPSKDITQAVGGVKGTNDLAFDDLLYYVEQVFVEPLLHDTVYYNNNTILGKYTDCPTLRASAAVVNARDGLRKDDASQTPLQFFYEPADCRIYYTPEMTVDISASWKAVADSAFRGINHCVAGSLGSNAAPAAAIKREAGSQLIRRRSAEEKRALDDSVQNIWHGQGNAAAGGGYMMI